MSKIIGKYLLKIAQLLIGFCLLLAVGVALILLAAWTRSLVFSS